MILKPEICPSDSNIVTIDIDGFCIQMTLFEEQTLSHKECVDQFQTAVNICGLDEKAIQNHLDINKVSATIEIYSL